MENLIVFMGQSELSDKLGVLYTTIGDWIKMGLPCYQVGKDVFFHEDDVVAFLGIKESSNKRKNLCQLKDTTNVNPKLSPAPLQRLSFNYSCLLY